MLLRPVKADHPAVPLRQQEPGWVEPWLGHPFGEVGVADPALLGMVREGPRVDGEPGVVVDPRPEAADRDAVGERWARAAHRRALEPSRTTTGPVPARRRGRAPRRRECRRGPRPGRIGRLGPGPRPAAPVRRRAGGTSAPRARARCRRRRRRRAGRTRRVVRPALRGPGSGADPAVGVAGRAGPPRSAPTRRLPPTGRPAARSLPRSGPTSSTISRVVVATIGGMRATLARPRVDAFAGKPTVAGAPEFRIR